ncbi:MAG TPA: ABC transporter ATP-binding protein [Acidimicrobiia bacterium]|nr:ABC transporter ATP-binding protein [Acidimicrobiia bacterium]
MEFAGGRTVLELKDVTKTFGGLHALDELSFKVESGEILGMIGPNGSGKSTAFNVITGSLKADSGNVTFDGEDITGLPSHRVSHKGISRTFQVVRPFPHLTALENVLVGRLFGGDGDRKSTEALEHGMEVLELVGLSEKANLRAGAFTILERKWLEVGRALATRPKLMLLDEFMAGISSSEVHHAVDLVKSINATGVTVILVEHIVKAITEACDRVVVLDAGRKLAEGTVDQIVNDPDVIKAYLGSRHAGG